MNIYLIIRVKSRNNFLPFQKTRIQCQKMKSSKMNMNSMVDFVTSGDISELSELSSDDESEDKRKIMGTIQKQKELGSSDNNEDVDEDDIPLAQLAANQIRNYDTTQVKQPSN